MWQRFRSSESPKFADIEAREIVIVSRLRQNSKSPNKTTRAVSLLVAATCLHMAKGSIMYGMIKMYIRFLNPYKKL